MHHFDVIILGAGAAGMMCAAEAGKRGRSVALLDHADKLGKKILISGGGRCNFTNVGASPKNYVSENEHFATSAMKRFTPQDFLNLVDEAGIAYHEKKLGQLFCDITAQSIVDLLVNRCKKYHCEFFLNRNITSVEKKENLFIIKAQNETFSASSVVVATGGLSVPKVGASGFGYEIAEQFGLSMTELSPALDGFVFAGMWQKRLSELAGISLDVNLTCGGVSFRENVLFTHVGLSGPASLQGSLYFEPHATLQLNLFPDEDAFAWLKKLKDKHPKSNVPNQMKTRFPDRFAEHFCAWYQAPKTILAETPDKALQEFARHLQAWELRPEKTVGYQKAEVTRGGVSTSELSSKTMEAKKVPGLYFVGELVDVTGWLGGYNFQWAWASGWAAGQYA